MVSTARRSAALGGSTALQNLNRVMASRPESVTQAVRRNMAFKNGSDGNSPQDAVEFMRRWSGFAGHRDLAQCMVILSQVWNSLEAGDVAQAHARAALGLASIDQAARDGRWELGQMLSRGIGPPSECLRRRPEKTLLEPNTPLADPSWVAAGQAFLRESAQTEKAYKDFGKGKGKGKEKDED